MLTATDRSPFPKQLVRKPFPESGLQCVRERPLVRGSPLRSESLIEYMPQADTLRKTTQTVENCIYKPAPCLKAFIYLVVLVAFSRNLVPPRQAGARCTDGET